MAGSRDDFINSLFGGAAPKSRDEFLRTLPRTKEDALRNSPAGRDAVDGVSGMYEWQQAAVRRAQQQAGDAGGDLARLTLQGQGHLRRGVVSGAHTASGMLYQGAADLTGALGDNAVSRWLSDMAGANSHSAAAAAAAGMSNYQTQEAGALAQGVVSAGQMLPATAATVITRNPAYATGGGAVVEGGGAYLTGRQDEGLGVLPALNYGLRQGTYGALGEILPARGLAGMASRGINPGRVGNYLLGDIGGEIATGIAQSADTTATLNNTAQGWQDWRGSLADQAYETALASVSQGGVNLATVGAVNALRKQPRSRQQFLDMLDVNPGAAPKTPPPGAAPEAASRMTPEEARAAMAAAGGNEQAVRDAAATVRAATANGGMKTRTDVPTPANMGTPKNRTDLRQVAQNPNVRKMLDLIAHTEGTKTHGYHTLVGGSRIEDLSRHPNKVGLTTKDGNSTAFGRYQITGTTWRGLQKQYGFTDMSAASQDEAAVALLARRGALNDVLSGNFEQAIGKLGDEWVSLPSSTNKNQGKRSWDEVRRVLGSSAPTSAAPAADVSGSLNQPTDMTQPEYTQQDNSAAMEELAAAVQEQRQAAEQMQDAARRIGRQTKVYLDEQMRNARLQVLEADEMAPTLAGAANQYRDRNRAASQVQVNNIANNLHPELLGDSMEAGTGAPTLARDGQTVIGGNGRVMAIAQAYHQGNGGGYKQYLLDNAEQFGLNRDEVAAIKKPVLVRRLEDDVDIARAAVASNEGGGLGMSALEQARVNADRLPDLGTFVPDDGGELNTPANRGFIRQFVGQMPTTVQAQMVGADGRLSQDGVRALQNALLYRAYGNSPALSRMVESTDQGARNIVNAMMQAAPAIAKARDHIRSGAMHDADIAADIVAAAETINQIRESGGSVADYLAQQGLLEDDLSLVARDLVAFLDEHKRSAKAIATLLRNYYDALAAQGSPAQADVFGDNAAPDKQQLLRKANNDYRQQNGTAEHGELFGKTEAFRGVVEPNRQAEQQPESRRGDETGVGEDARRAEEQRDGLKFSRGAMLGDKKKSDPADFNEALQQAGGFAAYEAAKAAGETELTFHQWQQVRTPEFKAWFGDWENDPDNASKVINPKTGEPLVVYHGTNQNITAFDPARIGLRDAGFFGSGFYSTPDEGFAQDYADTAVEDTGEGEAAAMPLYVSLQNPFIWDMSDEGADATRAALAAAGIKRTSVRGNSAALGNAKERKIFNRAVREQGYDGVIVRDEDGIQEVVAFRPEQIKSATDNSGAFDPKNDDIRYSRREDTKRASPEQIKQTRQAIEQAVGKQNMRHIEIVAREEVARPDNVQDLLNAQGWYNPKTGKITLVADALPNVRTAQFVAWHELGHRKIDVDGWEKWQALFRAAYNGNAVIKQAADHIYKQRRGAADGAALDKFRAVEEAVADLYAATQTGDYAAFEQRNGAKVPMAMRDTLGGYLSRLANHLRTVLAKVMGVQRNTISDADIYGWMQKLDKTGETLSDGLNDDAKFSRQPKVDNSKSAYEAAKAAGETELTFRQWQQVRTPEFKAWFGDWENDPDNASKVINPKTGEPLVVYHGTGSDFTQFNRMAWGSADPRLASEYAEMRGEWYGGQANVMPVYMSIRRPFDADTLDTHSSFEYPDGLSVTRFIDQIIEQSGVNESEQRELRALEKSIRAAAREEESGPSYLPEHFWYRPVMYFGEDGARQIRRVFEIAGFDGIRLTEQGAVTYGDFRPEQIKSATGNSGAFDPKNDDIRYSRGEPLGKEERRFFNEVGELGAGVAAYDKLTELLKPALAKARLANGHPQAFTQHMRDYRAQLNVAGQTAKDIAGAGKKMTADERRLLSDVLEMELPPGAEVSPELQELAGAVREILSQQGDDLVALEMLSEASRERFGDTYLPRLYQKHMSGDVGLDKLNKELGKAMRGALGNAVKGSHLKGRGIFKEVKRSEQASMEAQGWEMRHDYGDKGKKADTVVMWRDYTRAERAKMGEERDAILRFTSGYIKTQADIAKGMLFKRIAQDGEMASDTPVEGWTHVPDTVIAATGGVKRYGALAGMYVHPEVAYHLQQQFFIDNAVQKVWRSVLGWWKLGKTVYNPVAHVNNVVSNIAMTFAAGGRLRDLPAMALEMKRKGALYREALEQGLIGEAVDVAGLQEMFVGLNNVSDDKLLDGLIMRTLKRADKLVGGAVSKTGQAMQKAYRVEDEVFKLALYKRGKEQGLSPREAADYALTFMFDYSEVPQGIKWVRDTGILPFVSYTYKAIPAVARVALTRPHRALAITGLLYGINALSYAMLGGEADEDEERKYMPDYQKGYTVFGTPKLIRLPFNDSKGKPVFVDVYRWLPLGDFADTQNQMGGVPLPQFLTPNGPVVNHAFALLGNKDTFTGRDIVKPYMSGGEKTATYGKWLAAQWLPASVGVPFSYHTNNVLDGVKNQFEGTKMAKALEWMGYTGTTYRGEDKQLYRSLSGAFGVKLRGEKPADMKAAQQRRLGYEAREIKADISRIRRDNTLSDTTKQARLQKRQAALQRLYEQMPE